MYTFVFKQRICAATTVFLFFVQLFTLTGNITVTMPWALWVIIHFFLLI